MRLNNLRFLRDTVTCTITIATGYVGELGAHLSVNKAIMLFIHTIYSYILHIVLYKK